MLRLTPFLLFDGNCAEAMRFYQACLGGSLTLTPLAETPMKANFPAEKHSRIIYALLQSELIELSATDWLHPVRQPHPGNTVALFLTADTRDALESIFQRLREGANPTFLTELQSMPFGVYGSLTDRFGVDWIFRAASSERPV
jgi:PhnB protein